MAQASGIELKPSLWRTCRALANRKRLRLLAELLAAPKQTVGALAKRADISEALASLYLRSLNARGLISSQREGRFLLYSADPDPRLPPARQLLSALRPALRNDDKSINWVFERMTLFTHPRRIVLVHALANGIDTPRELVRQTGISLPALVRHLRKLRRRGILRDAHNRYQLAKPVTPLDRALFSLARETPPEPGSI